MFIITITKDSHVVMIDESDSKDRSIIYHSELKHRKDTIPLLNQLWDIVQSKCKQ